MKEERFLSYFIGRRGRVRWREYSSRPTRWLVILRESFCPLRPFSHPGKGLSPLDFSLSRLSDSSAIRRLYSPPPHGLAPALSPDGTGLSNRFSSHLSFPFLSLALYPPRLYTGGFIYYPRLLRRTAASGQLSAPEARHDHLMREAARIYRDAKPPPHPSSQILPSLASHSLQPSDRSLWKSTNCGPSPFRTFF